MLKTLLLSACILAALCGGVFFAFSTFVMRGLGRVGDAQAADAMRAINVTVFTPWFMLPLFGLVLVAAGATLSALGRGEVFWLTTGGAAVYTIGCIGVTMLGNVPLNNALAAARGAMPWAEYFARWQVWNHLRTAACLLSAVLFGLAAVRAGA